MCYHAGMWAFGIPRPCAHTLSVENKPLDYRHHVTGHVTFSDIYFFLHEPCLESKAEMIHLMFYYILPNKNFSRNSATPVHRLCMVLQFSPIHFNLWTGVVLFLKKKQPCFCNPSPCSCSQSCIEVTKSDPLKTPLFRSWTQNMKTQSYRSILGIASVTVSEGLWESGLFFLLG